MAHHEQAAQTSNILADSEAIEDPRAAVELIRADNTRVSAMFATGTQAIYVVWGLVWLIGYAILAMSSWQQGEPQMWAYLVYASALLCGVLFSTIFGIRSSSGWRGQSRIKGAVYGWSWLIAFGVGMTICTQMVYQFNISDAQAGRVYNCVAAFIVGLEYIMGSVLTDFDLPAFLGGVFMLLLSVCMIQATSGRGYVLMAALGGGSFLFLAMITYLSTRSYRQAMGRGGLKS
ncbi:hypothetical protein KIMH_07300 [Bombiscardovia apis]|uniref:Uncharacterized protein n=1 Tax=Bombiscardovia apis TaxID=2932182 RepID=A0ABM8BCK9_9BIFI|nr:hypothetical protein [Bombiscardovia apis]BDR54619.1 hypothetical protein KIMH_07300 [Bombiscardovia apis]